MIIPEKEKVLVRIIYCPICKKYYNARDDELKKGCIRFHARGTCCHYGDYELTKKEAFNIYYPLEGKSPILEGKKYSDFLINPDLKKAARDYEQKNNQREYKENNKCKRK